MHTAELDSAVVCTVHTAEFFFYKFEYFGKIKTEFENTSALVIRGPDGFESGKKLEVENLVTHSL